MEFSRCEHGIRWQLKIGSGYCLACALEFLESQDKPLIRKRHIFHEVANGLREETSDFLFAFEGTEQNLKQLCSIFIDVAYEQQDMEVVQVVHNCFMVLVQAHGCYIEDIIATHVIAKCYSISKHQEFPPVLSLLLRLIENSARICQILLMDERNFNNFLLSTMEYPNNDLQLIVLQIYSQQLQIIAASPYRDQDGPAVLRTHFFNLPAKLFSLISTGDCTEILLQSLRVLEYASSFTDFLLWLGDVEISEISDEKDVVSEVVGSVLAGLKRLILRRDDLLTPEVVECIMLLLGRRGEVFREPLLDADLAEFIYDALRSTTAPKLVSSIYCCILLLAECDSFHQNCHSSYGLESILRSLQEMLRSSQSTICAQGLTLIGTILKGQPANTCILKTLSLFDRTVEVMKDGIKNKHPNVAIAATETAATLIEHFPAVFPLQEVEGLLDTMNDRLAELVSLMAGGTRDKSKNENLDVEAVDINMDERLNDRSSLVRKLFSSAWNVLHRVCDLVSSDSSPSSDDHDNHGQCQPHTGALVDKLLQSTEGVWLPLTAKTLEALSSPSVMHSMLVALTATCKISTSTTLTEKLTRGVFIRLAMTAKARFSRSSRHSDLLESCCEFLHQLSCAGIRESLGQPSPRFQSLLRSGFLGIQGKISEYINLLNESCSGPTASEPTLAVHCAVLALIFNSHWYGGREIVSSQGLKTKLDAYLILNDTLDHLPNCTIRQIGFLYAICQSEISIPPQLPYIMMKWLSGNSSFIRHPAFISFVLRLPQTEPPTAKLQECVIKSWVATSGANPDENMEECFEVRFLTYICERSEPAAKALMRALISCNSNAEHVIADKLLEIVYVPFKYHHQKMLHGDGMEISAAFCQKVMEDVPKFAYNRFSRAEDATPFPPSTLLKLVRLLLLITDSANDNMETYSYLLRVLKLLLSFISKDNYEDFLVIEQSLRLVQAVLSNERHENQVRSAVLAVSSQANFIKKLATWGADDTPKGTLVLGAANVISLLITLHHRYGILSPHNIKLPAERSINLSWGEEIRASLTIWSALFETSFSSLIVRQETSPDQCSVPASTVQPEDCRMVWNQALNLTASQCPRSRELAFRCALAVLKYVSAADINAANRLVDNPWLSVALQRTSDDIGNVDLGTPPTWAKGYFELRGLVENLAEQSQALQMSADVEDDLAESFLDTTDID